MRLKQPIKLLILSAVLFIFLLIAPSGLIKAEAKPASLLASQSSVSQVTEQSIEASQLEFEQRIHQVYAAWNSHNPHALSQFYAQDAGLIFYDALPMQYVGWANYEAGIQTHLFDNMPKFQLTPQSDVQVTRRGNVVWTTFTWHLSAQFNDGTPIEADGRQTDIWEQRDGNWLIVHEHISAPVSL